MRKGEDEKEDAKPLSLLLLLLGNIFDIIVFIAFYNSEAKKVCKKITSLMVILRLYSQCPAFFR
jgi:hypothetical protein